MNLKGLVEDIFGDLQVVEKSLPNERLPKEEQIRSRLYASLLEECEAVCVERGYNSIDDQSLVECDLWAKDTEGRESWIELK